MNNKIQFVVMSITVFQSFISSITDTDDLENKMDLNWTEKTLNASLLLLNDGCYQNHVFAGWRGEKNYSKTLTGP